MDSLRILFSIIFIFSAFLMLLGLYQPWWVLWWEDVQNRRKVLTLYGSIMIIAGLLKLILERIS